MYNFFQLTLIFLIFLVEKSKRNYVELVRQKTYFGSNPFYQIKIKFSAANIYQSVFSPPFKIGPKNSVDIHKIFSILVHLHIFFWLKLFEN